MATQRPEYEFTKGWGGLAGLHQAQALSPSAEARTGRESPARSVLTAHDLPDGLPSGLLVRLASSSLTPRTGAASLGDLAAVGPEEVPEDDLRAEFSGWGLGSLAWSSSLMKLKSTVSHGGEVTISLWPAVRCPRSSTCGRGDSR